MKTLLLTLCLTLGWVALATGEVGPDDELHRFGDTLAYFYLNPSEGAFSDLQEGAERLRGEIESSPGVVDVLVPVVLARISEKHGWTMDDSPFAEMARAITDGQSDLAKYVNNDDAVDPTKLDIWWVSFSGTGETAYLEKIFQYAGQELPEDDVAKLLIVGAAKWSFKANCRQHERVMDFARAKLETGGLTEEQASYLQECVAQEPIAQPER